MVPTDGNVLIAAARWGALVAALVTMPPIPHMLPPQIPRPSSIEAEVVQIRFHIAQPQVIDTNPLVDEGSDIMKTLRVPTSRLCIEAAANEQVAVDQLVDESRYDQATVIPPVLKNRS